MIITECVQCKKEIRARNKNQIYCSTPCKYLYHTVKYRNYYKMRYKRYGELNKQHQATYYSKPYPRFRRYIRNAKKRNIVFRITLKYFMEFWQKPCGYCGEPVLTIGIDRIDPKKGYVEGNLKSCCWKCNRMKHNLMEEEFINHCKRVAKYAN